MKKEGWTIAENEGRVLNLVHLTQQDNNILPDTPIKDEEEERKKVSQPAK